MDCNKDEAIRLKELAEKKMAGEDFEGARAFALRAQRLYPQLENITQLLSVCDVHRSAQNRIQFEKDWYGILQIGRSADDSAIKTQYRRMALLLHPDKNRLPGAEAAFKLISDANAILSDSSKKFAYDIKIRPPKLQPQPPPHHRNVNINQHTGPQNNFTWCGSGNFTPDRAGMFWTFCTGCNKRYHVEREYRNKNILCKYCSKTFFAVALGGQNVFNFTQPAAHVSSKPGSSQVGVRNAKGHSASYAAGSQKNSSTKPVQPKPGIKIGSNCEGSSVPSALRKPNAQVPPKPNSSKVLAGKVGVQNSKGQSSYAAPQEDISTRPVQPEPGTKAGSNSEGINVPNNFRKPNAQVPSKRESSTVVAGKVGVQNSTGQSASYAASQENAQVPSKWQGIKVGSNCQGMNLPNAQVPPKPVSSKVGMVPSQGFSKVGVQNFKGHSASHAGIVTGSNREGTHVVSAVSINENLKASGTSTNYKDGENQPRDLKKNKKRGRKIGRDSRESFDNSDDSDYEIVINKVTSGNCTTGVNSKQRSSQRKQDILYNETNDDDDLVQSDRLKKSKVLDSEDSKLGIQKNFPANANCSEIKNKEKDTTRVEESMKEKDATFGKEERVGGEINSGADNGTKLADVESDSDLEFDSDVSDLESDSAGDVAGETYECADTEFYDFEKERDGIPFRVGQVWACYDDSDTMPRYYAKVMKANSSPFQVSFKWLEADPTSEAYEEMPGGCGTYKLSRKTEYISSRNMFSHQMTNFLPGKKRGSLVVHPKKGEIWALFKKSNPETGKGFQYQVAEVLSDFDDGAGVNVCLLNKIDGHVSVFQKAGEVKSFMIGPDELHRFSHLVPSYNLLGCDGVPAGSLELDPASLPSNPDDVHFPGKAEKGSVRMDCSPPKASDDNVPVESARMHAVIDVESD